MGFYLVLCHEHALRGIDHEDVEFVRLEALQGRLDLFFEEGGCQGMVTFGIDLHIVGRIRAFYVVLREVTRLGYDR